jgi:cellulose synthase/poly-beta-1,6-N-acetylglucosamine synthase-like glycosyltransferase/peptidoglycan/xylan/chitin deacetylase (PgdA/CDA1 family)
MVTKRQLHGAAAQAASQIVFVDPSGRRWRKLCIIGAVLAAFSVVGILAAVPHINDIPALSMTGERFGPPLTSDTTGKRVPVVGQGPLVRVLEVHRENGQTIGLDPSTKRVEATFTAAEQEHIEQSEYVIRRFGYSATAQRTISLTFDDGPDLKWTPELLNVLSAERVPATFFATGTMIARNPEIFHREVREGHAVANHSLTHVDVSSTPDWRARLELTITDHVIRAVTGKEVGYFRLPYEGSDENSTQAAIEGMLRSQRYGYLVTSHDFDSDDWRYSSHQLTGEMPLPTLNGQNITVLLHDGGAPDRKVTIDYVRRLIAYAKAQGYTFTTMPQVQPCLAERVFDVKPTVWDKLTLNLVQIWFVWPSVLLRALFVIAVTFVIVIGFTNCVIAAIRRRRRNGIIWQSASEDRMPVSVMMAAYNEEQVIGRTLSSVLASRYPVAEVIVVNDGSSDHTAEKVLEIARQDPRIILVDQQNTGKAGALNAGLDKVTNEVVVTLDADTILIPRTIGRLIRHFIADKSGRLGAVAGIVRVGNRGRNLLTRWQALEYVTQVGIERAAQDVMGAIAIVPGACAAWRKAAIQAAGGYTNVTLAEDCDLSLSLHRAGWRVTQDDEAIAFTEVPENVDTLLNQRTRWTFGTLQAIWKHQDLLFRPRYGFLGLYVLPQYAITVILPIVFMPFIVFMGVRTAQVQGIQVVLYYFLLFMAAHLLIAAIGILLIRENWRHLLMVPVYRIVFEPLRAYLLYTAVYMAVRGVRAGWNKAARTGRLDTGLITVRQNEQEAVAIGGATE